MDLSNRLIFLFIFAALGSARMSLRVHFDQLGVTVHVTRLSLFLITTLCQKFKGLSQSDSILFNRSTHSPVICDR